MVILYRTTKFKSANNLAIAILGSIAKFNSHEYFRLYGINFSYTYIQNYKSLATMLWRSAV